MVGIDQEVDDVAADEAGPARDEDTHDRPGCPAPGRSSNGMGLTNW
jgi:hypothetical protein